MSERVGTNDTYYEACRKLADIAIRTQRYYASAHQPCVTEQEIVEFEEWYWVRKNLIDKHLGDHHVIDFLYSAKKGERHVVATTINGIDSNLEQFQWYRDLGNRWTLHVEDFQLHFGHKPIVENWQRLKQQALTFIQDLI